MKYFRFLFALCWTFVFSSPVFAQAIQKNRVIVLTDIEADPDDSQSLIRLLLYSNQIDIKGIIATTSAWQKNRIAPESIVKIIQAYGKVQPNLNKHEPGFPDPKAVLSIVKKGPAKYGMLAVGHGHDSEGSDWIIKVLEENDDRPLHLSVWGGVNTLAQAVYKIKETRSATELKRLVRKLTVYTISDQDDSGIWLRNNFPELKYIVSPGDDYGSSTWSAINTQVNGISNEEISNKWIAENIQQDHGPLGAAYPDVAWGMEGDTPAFLSLIENGLNNSEHPDWGGWGGRYELIKPDFGKQKKGSSGVPFEPETRAIWTDAVDNYIPFVPNDFGRAVKSDSNQYSNNKVTIWRWRADFQNDFAARMDWCLADYNKANHPPVPVINTKEEITVSSGQNFGIDASETYDPDGDSFSYLWFNYAEAGTFKKDLKISTVSYNSVWVQAPYVNKKETTHIILKITDKGTPQLSRYKRIVVTIMPK